MYLKTSEDTMSALQAIPDIVSLLNTWIVLEKRSFSSISDQLKQHYPNVRGLSARSIKRFCSSIGVRVRSQLTDDQVDRIVTCAVRKVSDVIEFSLKCKCDKFV